ncbi:carboxy-S-adenosyl-L-methionine synthase CmoA [Kiritimatiellaeota bacterium B1221]|nr:carboxy-S-adenosyl-L-methionine synthase CmoA [Kiritimatiellaeota bacterium B1221]
MRDNIYHQQDARPASFEFNEAVAKVFPDMIARSVPGYAATLRLIGSIADRYVTPGSRVYDLGCSLGAGSFSVQNQIGDRAEITAVDLSSAMIEALNREVELKGIRNIHPRMEDVRETEIREAKLTLLNFTLQFVPVEDRQTLLARIARGTLAGGVLVLSEKICFEDPVMQEEMRRLHEAFKRENGYSDLEISRKRAAIEKVLIPETIAVHQARLRESGFSRSQVWLQCFNFVSLLAFRD